MQDKLFKGYRMSVFNQMLYVNLCSAVASFAGNFLAYALNHLFT